MFVQLRSPTVRSPRQADLYNAGPFPPPVDGAVSPAASTPGRTGGAGAAGAAAHARRPSISLFHLRPPYAEASPYRLLGGAERDPLPFGAILGVEIRGSVPDWSELERTILALRRQAVAAPLVLVIDPEAEDLIFVATRVARLPVRAVLFRGEPLDGTLRRQITRPSSLPDDVVEWLSLRGTRLTPMTAELIRQIFAHASEHHEIVSLLREMGNPESSARFRCRKKRLPSPGRWLHAARALNTAFRMQAEPSRPLLQLAHELGYADHSALSNQMLRVFRMRPGAVRRILGWEWLLDRWLAAEAGKTRKPARPRDRLAEN